MKKTEIRTLLLCHGGDYMVIKLVAREMEWDKMYLFYMSERLSETSTMREQYD